MLFGCSLGKSKELLKTLLSASLSVILHSETFRLLQLYEKLNIKFDGRYTRFDAATIASYTVTYPPTPKAGDSFLSPRVKHRRATVTTS